MDSANQQDNDFTPFLNIINEFYVKDSSKKVKASMKQKGESDEYLTTNPPYGYMKDPHNPKRHWIIDDSISTACETTIQAVLSLCDVGVLLIGGMDRGIDYAPLIDFLRVKKVPNVICMYESGKRIFTEAKEIEGTNLVLVSDLYKACEVAKKLVKSGQSCLLSPASASYGHFKNFEERGDKFKEYMN